MVQEHGWSGRGERLCSWKCQHRNAAVLGTDSRLAPSEPLGLLSLLHKRVENSRFKQGCRSEEEFHAGVFWIPSEFVAPRNASEPRAAPTPGSVEGADPGARELPLLGLTFAHCSCSSVRVWQRTPSDSRSLQPPPKTRAMQNHLGRLPREPSIGLEDLGPNCKRKARAVRGRFHHQYKLSPAERSPAASPGPSILLPEH